MDDVPLTDVSTTDDVPPDLTIREIDEAFELQNARMTVWYFEPGEEIQYHAHAKQEENFYILKGRFSVKIGRSGETELIEIGPQEFSSPGPGIGHGHRYLGDDRGVVLAFDAPTVDDPGLDPHQLP